MTSTHANAQTRGRRRRDREAPAAPPNETPRILAVAFALVAALGLGGCVVGTQREGRPIAATDIATIQIGATTRQQVLDRFGPPTSRAAPDVADAPFRGATQSGTSGASLGGVRTRTDRDTYVYRYFEDHEKFFSFVLLYTWYKRVRLTDTLMIGFDPSGMVEHVAFARQTETE